MGLFTLLALLLNQRTFAMGGWLFVAAGLCALAETALADPSLARYGVLGAGMFIGSCVCVSGLIEGLRDARFYRRAKLAWGVVDDVESQSSEWSDYRGRHGSTTWQDVSLVFNDHEGKPHKTTVDVKSSEALTDERYELLFYDPEYPAHVETLDDPATGVRVLPDGNLAAKHSPWRRLGAMLTLAVLSAGALFLLMHQ